MERGAEPEHQREKAGDPGTTSSRLPPLGPFAVEPGVEFVRLWALRRDGQLLHKPFNSLCLIRGMAGCSQS